jgi:hypothetical protein
MMFIGVTLLATLLASLTDWLFFDLLVHRMYNAAPGIWRPGGRLRIITSQVVGTIATAAAVEIAMRVPGYPIHVAFCLWGGGALPIMLQNAQWMRIHPVIAASHALGWLARLLIATLLAAMFF